MRKLSLLLLISLLLVLLLSSGLHSHHRALAATPTPGSASTQVAPASENTQPPDRVGNILLGAIITLGVIGGGLMVVGALLGRKPRNSDS